MSRKGLTLLEVLIAMTMVSMIAVIIGSVFGLGIRAWDKGESNIEDSQRLRFFTERISEQIKSIYPYQIDIDGKRVVAFQGRPDSIWFVAVSPNGLRWAAYFLKDKKLVFQQGIIPDKKVLEKIFSDGEVIDSGISNIEFEYLSPEEGDERKESWELEKTLPRAIKVKTNNSRTFFISLPSNLKKHGKK
ncbi:MAG: hypothetical protein CVV37_04700 [Nitrospira bacterium HGW-Nitrospira-1]|nr:MAG: hypothetical protein CVV37_04700 [Nitrospira bacterium HGW-Nitrospira-1]